MALEPLLFEQHLDDGTVVRMALLMLMRLD
jgi:hypothetical protein